MGKTEKLPWRALDSNQDEQTSQNARGTRPERDRPFQKSFYALYAVLRTEYLEGCAPAVTSPACCLAELQDPARRERPALFVPPFPRV